MRKKVIQATLLVLLTLLLPLGLTWVLNHDRTNSNLPVLEDIQIFASSQDSIPLTLDEYVTGVVLASIPVYYEYETLKAQAVIARTYALKNITICEQQRKSIAIIDSIHPKSKSYSTKELGLTYSDPDTYLQYMGSLEYEAYLMNVRNAVNETKGQIITYKEEPITPLFFSTSAGKTRDSKDIWSVRIPYLISVDSNQDVESPNYLKVSIYTMESVVQTLQSAYQAHLLGASDYDYQVYTTLPLDSGSFFDDVEIIKRDSAGYVLTVSLGGVLISGDAFASALGLGSSYFYIENYEDSVRLICNGSGHGIGFSQYGANIMAQKSNFTYEELLTYYYTGVKITKVQY